MKFQGFDTGLQMISGGREGDSVNPWSYDLAPCTGGQHTFDMVVPYNWNHIKRIPIFIHQTAGTGAGLCEFNVWEWQSGTTVRLRYPLQNTYSAGAQLQLVNQCRNLSITSAYGGSVGAWNGTTGGLLVLTASHSIVVSADINVSGKGFRGAPAVSGNEQWGAQGEGYTNFNQSRTYWANTCGGGGGQGDSAAENYEGAGAGGGGNGGAGAKAANFGPKVGGYGGDAVGSLTLDPYMSLGGGGGSGGTDNGGGVSGAGGNGGGIIVLAAPNIILNANLIADGWGGGNGNNPWSGGGGGGAGGSILLIGDNIQGGLRCYARGAGAGVSSDGGNPGGAGGAGRTAIYYGAGSSIWASGDTVGWAGQQTFKPTPTINTAVGGKKSVYAAGWEAAGFDRSISDGGFRYKLANECGSLSFDGVDDYVSAPTNGCVTGYYTIEAWIKNTEFKNTILMYATADDNANRLIVHFPWSDHNYYFDEGNITVNGRFYSVYPKGFINNWTHVIFSQTAIGKMVFVNGRRIGIDGVNITFNPAGKTFRIGGDGTTNSFKGLISEMRIYNREIRHKEALEHYQGIYKNNANLTHWYKFNQGTGSQLTDFSGNNNHGTISGAAWSTEWCGGTKSKNDTALSFNGMTDYVDCSNSAAYDVTRLTMEAWVKSNNYSQLGFIFEKGSVNTQYAMFFENASGLCFRTYNSVGTGHSFYATQAEMGIENGKLYHIACTYDGSFKRIFVNGIEKKSVAYTEVLKTGQAGQRIGAYGGASPAYFFRGIIDEVRIYGRALGQAELTQHYQGIFADDTALVGYYDFNEDGGWFEYDQTANAATGARLAPSYVPTIVPYLSNNYGANSQKGNGFYLDGSDAFWMKNPDVALTGDLTITWKMWLSNMRTARINPIDKAYWGEFGLTLETDGNLSYFHGNGSLYFGGTFASGFLASTWYDVAIVRNVAAKTVKLYINGAYHSTLDYSASAYVPTATATEVKLGYGYTGVFAVGYINSLKIWNRQLNSTEVANYRADPASVSNDNCVCQPQVGVKDIGYDVNGGDNNFAPLYQSKTRWDNYTKNMVDLKVGKQYRICQFIQNSSGLTFTGNTLVKTKAAGGGTFLLQFI